MKITFEVGTEEIAALVDLAVSERMETAHPEEMGSKEPEKRVFMPEDSNGVHERGVSQKCPD